MNRPITSNRIVWLATIEEARRNATRCYAAAGLLRRIAAGVDASRTSALAYAISERIWNDDGPMTDIEKLTAEAVCRQIAEGIETTRLSQSAVMEAAAALLVEMGKTADRGRELLPVEEMSEPGEYGEDRVLSDEEIADREAEMAAEDASEHEYWQQDADHQRFARGMGY